MTRALFSTISKDILLGSKYVTDLCASLQLSFQNILRWFLFLFDSACFMVDCVVPIVFILNKNSLVNYQVFIWIWNLAGGEKNLKLMCSFKKRINLEIDTRVSHKFYDETYCNARCWTYLIISEYYLLDLDLLFGAQPWNSRLLAYLTLSKFLLSEQNLLNLLITGITFSPTNVFGCFSGVMAHFEHMKHKFPN